MKKKSGQRIKRCLKWGFSVCLAGVLLFLGINTYVKSTTGKRIETIEELKQTKAEQPDAAIVLGAQVRTDGQMSMMLKERVDVGIELYHKGIVSRIIMSGDHGQNDYDEVNTMKNYAIEQGVPSEHIFMDHAGFSTYETMYRAKEIFQVESAIIVTQEYHLYRALYNAQTMGIDAKGVVCDTAVYSGDTMRKLREMLARVKDVGYAVTRPEPTYLGDVIPVSGDGDVTNDY